MRCPSRRAWLTPLVFVFRRFYDGGRRERDILWRAYLRLIKHVNSIFKVGVLVERTSRFYFFIFAHGEIWQIRIAYEWTEDYVIKYLWSAAGYCLISIPVLFTRRRAVGVQTGARPAETHDEVASRTESAFPTASHRAHRG